MASATDITTASCIWQGKHVQATSQGILVQGTNAIPWQDGASWPTTTVRGAWIHQGVAAYQRLWRITIIGQRNGFCAITAAVFTNYDDTAPAETIPFDLGSGSTIAGLPKLQLQHHVATQQAMAHSVQIADAPPAAGASTVGYGGIELGAIRYTLGVKPGAPPTPTTNKG